MNPPLDNAAITPAEVIALPALLTLTEVQTLTGYKTDNAAKRWLTNQRITARKNSGSRKWPRAAIVAALNGTNPTPHIWRPRA